MSISDFLVFLCVICDFQLYGFCFFYLWLPTSDVLFLIADVRGFLMMPSDVRVSDYVPVFWFFIPDIPFSSHIGEVPRSRIGESQGLHQSRNSNANALQTESCIRGIQHLNAKDYDRWMHAGMHGCMAASIVDSIVDSDALQPPMIGNRRTNQKKQHEKPKTASQKDNPKTKHHNKKRNITTINHHIQPARTIDKTKRHVKSNSQHVNQTTTWARKFKPTNDNENASRSTS